jgi:hypothetical protein
MNALLAILCLSLSSCSTTVRGPDGKVQFRTYANAKNITFTGPGTSFHADVLNHSLPTAAAGKAFNGAIGGVGQIITAGGAGMLIP